MSTQVNRDREDRNNISTNQTSGTKETSSTPKEEEKDTKEQPKEQPAPVPTPMPEQSALSIKDFRNEGVTDTRATLKWTAPKGSDAVQLQFSLDGKVWLPYLGVQIPVGSNAVTLNNLLPNTKYYFKLVAFGVSQRAESNVVQITTDKVALTKALNIQGNPKLGETLIAGDVLPKGATVTYQWQRASMISGPYEDISDGTSRDYIIKPVDINKYIRVKITGYGDIEGTVYSPSLFIQN